MNELRNRSQAASQDAAPRWPSIPAPDHIQEGFDGTNPVHIAQHALNVTGLALDTGDFALFELFFHVPHLVETFGGRQLLRTQDDLRLIFENSRHQNEMMGVATRVRRCLTAEFRDDVTLVAAHETRLMRGDLQLRDPIPCYSVMQKIGGIWQGTSSSYALEEKNGPYDSLLTRHGKPLEFSEE